MSAELAALQRAVPAIAWDAGRHAESGAFRLHIWEAAGFYSWEIYIKQIRVAQSSRNLRSLETAKSQCEAAFLRLVGCKS